METQWLWLSSEDHSAMLYLDLGFLSTGISKPVCCREKVMACPLFSSMVVAKAICSERSWVREPTRYSLRGSLLKGACSDLIFPASCQWDHLGEIQISNLSVSWPSLSDERMVPHHEVVP